MYQVIHSRIAWDRIRHQFKHTKNTFFNVNIGKTRSNNYDRSICYDIYNKAKAVDLLQEAAD